MSIFQQGYNAYEEFIRFEDNPYEPDTDAYLEWHVGWWASFDDYVHNLEQPVVDFPIGG